MAKVMDSKQASALKALIEAAGGVEVLRAALGVTAAEPVAEAPTVKPSWPSFLVTPQQAQAEHGVTVTRKGDVFTVVIDPSKVKTDPGRSKSGKSQHLAKPPSIGLSPDGKLRLSVDLVQFDED